MFVLFWTYGFYGSVVKVPFDNFYFQFLFSIFLFIIIYLLNYLGNKNEKYFSLTIILEKNDVVVFSLILLFWLIISFGRLNSPIVGDHLYYSINSKLQEITVILKTSNFISFFDFKFKDIIRIFDFFILVFFYLFFNLIRINKNRIFINTILIFAILLVFRTVIIYVGAGKSPHPPFQLFPLWLSSAIFGVNNFSFRLPQIMGLILISFLFFKIFKKFYSNQLSFLLCLTIIFIPVQVYAATVVEASIWSSTLIILVITLIITNNIVNIKQWVSISCIISVVVLMRITSIIIIPIFLILFLKNNFKLLKENKYILIYILIPLLICMPFVVQSIICGTPATYTIGSAPFIQNEVNSFNRVSFALVNGIIFKSVLSAISPPYLFLLLGLIIRYPFEKDYYINRLLIIFLIFLSIYMFFSINTGLWNVDRYKVEFMTPYLIIGFFLFFIYVGKLIKNEFIISIFAFIIISYGFYQLNRYPSSIHDPLENSIFKRITENIHLYEKPLLVAKKNGMANHTLLLGINYGVLPYILSDFNVSEVKNTKLLLEDQYNIENWLEYNAFKIDKNKDIKIVIISDLPSKLEIMKNLKSLGWKESGRFFYSADNYTIMLNR